MDTRKHKLTFQRMREIEAHIDNAQYLLQELRKRNAPPSEVNPVLKDIKCSKQEYDRLSKSRLGQQLEFPY